MKRILAMVLSLAIVAGLAITGTVAYLQDTDGEVNVMTLGNVYIDQHEYQRAVGEDGNFTTISTVRGDSYKLTDFTQSKPLYPAVGKDPSNPKVTGMDDTKVWFAQLADGEVKQDDMHYFGGMDVLDGLNNVQDKFVFVENIGKADAYIRTLIAYEAGSLTAEEWNALISRNENVFWKVEEFGIVNINENNYFVVEYVYDGNQYGEDKEVVTENGNSRHPDGIVHPGDWTYCSLAQVYMSPEGTNTDCENIDGNKNGTYDILTLSQAVQSAGFTGAQIALDTAFGDVDAANVQTWFGDVTIPTYATTVKELTDLLAKGGTVTLANDIALTASVEIPVGTTTTLNLNGKTITSDITGAPAIMNNGTLTISGNGTINNATSNAVKNAGTLFIENGSYSSGTTYALNNESSNMTIKNAVTTGGIYNAGTLTVDNITLNNTASGRHGVYNAGTATINGGTFSTTSGNELVHSIENAKANIYGGTFTQIGKSYLIGNAGTTTIYGGTFNGYVNADGSNDKMRPKNITVQGGTFNFDPTAWLATDYTVTDNGNGTWTVSPATT